jgi:cardiolipin synthase
MAERITLATKVTIARILLVPVFVIAFVHRDAVAGLGPLAFLLFGVIALADALDGALARARGERSELGAILDPTADKILVAASFVCLALAGLPPWVTIAIIGREAAVFGGWLLLRLFEKPSHVRPSPLGKVTTVAQFLLLTGGLWRVLVADAPTLAGDAVIGGLSVVVVGLTVISGLGYLRDALRRFEAEVPAARRRPDAKVA